MGARREPTPSPSPSGRRSSLRPVEDGRARAWIGRVLDERYRIDAVLGEGGMGAVFAAEHVKLRKRVAIKVILPSLSGNEEIEQRFAREATVAAELTHPHVAGATDCGTLSDGTAYLVMEIAQGTSLRRLMIDRPGPELSVEVGLQIADALAAAHERGIIHRDLKPDNVIVEERHDGELHAKVIDFGIARVTSSDVALTRIGTVIGTPGYMSPEQALGEPVDARADVYALGVILWEAVVGERLFERADPAALVLRQLRCDVPRLGAMVSDAPPELDALVARMLSRDKEQRPRHAGMVLEALRRIVVTPSSGERRISRSTDPDARTLSPAPARAMRPDPSGAAVASERERADRGSSREGREQAHRPANRVVPLRPPPSFASLDPKLDRAPTLPPIAVRSSLAPTKIDAAPAPTPKRSPPPLPLGLSPVVPPKAADGRVVAASVALSVASVVALAAILLAHAC